MNIYGETIIAQKMRWLWHAQEVLIQKKIFLPTELIGTRRGGRARRRVIDARKKNVTNSPE